MSALVLDSVSSASALQRKGRAGRTRPGRCFSLFTRERFEGRMRRYQAPEITRVPLEELVLQARAPLCLFARGGSGEPLPRGRLPPSLLHWQPSAHALNCSPPTQPLNP
jgi:ATP-dependent RNA helicase DHX29